MPTLTETLPQLVVQFFAMSEIDEWNIIQHLSLAASVCACGVLLADAEVMLNTVDSVRERYIEYFGYLPLESIRRAVLLLTLAAPAAL